MSLSTCQHLTSWVYQLVSFWPYEFINFSIFDLMSFQLFIFWILTFRLEFLTFGIFSFGFFNFFFFCNLNFLNFKYSLIQQPYLFFNQIRSNLCFEPDAIDGLFKIQGNLSIQLIITEFDCYIANYSMPLPSK